MREDLATNAETVIPQRIGHLQLSIIILFHSNSMRIKPNQMALPLSARIAM